MASKMRTGFPFNSRATNNAVREHLKHLLRAGYYENAVVWATENAGARRQKKKAGQGPAFSTAKYSEITSSGLRPAWRLPPGQPEQQPGQRRQPERLPSFGKRQPKGPGWRQAKSRISSLVILKN
jgi:hypothetical protein